MAGASLAALRTGAFGAADGDRVANRDELSTAARAIAAASSLSRGPESYAGSRGGAVSEARGSLAAARAGTAAGSSLPTPTVGDGALGLGRAGRGIGAGAASIPPCFNQVSRARRPVTTLCSSSTIACSSPGDTMTSSLWPPDGPSVELAVGEGGCAMDRDTNANSQLATYLGTTAHS